MIRIRIRKPKVRRDRPFVAEILPLDPRDDLVLRAKRAGRPRRAA
jgi:hypothetical protein